MLTADFATLDLAVLTNIAGIQKIPSLATEAVRRVLANEAASNVIMAQSTLIAPI